MRYCKRELFIIGLFSVLIVACYYLFTFGTLYIECPDANIYYSISSNFFLTRHFIQNAYPELIDFVVPFGLPTIILVLRCVVNSIYFVVMFQYALFACTNVLLFLATTKLSKSKISGYIAVIIYVFSIINNYVCGPAYILTENYFLFSIIAMIYVFVGIDSNNLKNSLMKLCIISFISTTIRPILVIVFIIIVLTFLYYSIKSGEMIKFIMINSIFILVIFINIIVNYREIGEFVLLENYSAAAVYQANNSNTKTKEFGSDLYKEFMDEEGIEIYENIELTTSQKSKLYSERTKIYMKNNKVEIIKNSLIKYRSLFIATAKPSFFIFIVAIVILAIMIKSERIKIALIFLIFVILTFETSLGLNILRYSIVALPFYALIQGAFWGIILNKVKDKWKNIY